MGYSGPESVSTDGCCNERSNTEWMVPGPGSSHIALVGRHAYLSRSSGSYGRICHSYWHGLVEAFTVSSHATCCCKSQSFRTVVIDSNLEGFSSNVNDNPEAAAEFHFVRSTATTSKVVLTFHNERLHNIKTRKLQTPPSGF